MSQTSKTSSYDSADVRSEMGKRLSRMMKERTEHEPNWKEVKEFILPRAGAFDNSDGNSLRIPNYDSILNSTATNAVKVFVAFIMAGMSSPARPWFKLTKDDLTTEPSPEESAWMDSFRDLMLQVFSKSNLYHVLPRVYEEGAGFGNGCTYISEDYQDVVRFYHYTVGTFYWGLSERLEVDTIYRPFKMKVGQVVRKFGKDAVSPSLLQKYNSGKIAEEVSIVHAIEPNVESLPKKLRPVDTTKKFVSIYYEQDSTEVVDKVLSVSGYRQFPAMPFRMNISADDPYGFGTGEDCLGDVRELQHKELELATALDYVTDPPLNSTGGMGHVFRHPGAVNIINPHMQEDLKPTYQIDYQGLQHVRVEINVLETRIREWFDNHLARHILDENRSNITAREIEAAEQEKLLLAGPVLESVQIFLSKIIDRTFEIMLNAGVGESPPQSMQGSNLNVEFLGVLAQAQKAVGVRSIERAINFIGGVAEMKESVIPGEGAKAWDIWDSDEGIRDYLRMIGTPSDQHVDPKAVEEIRAARAQAAQQQQAMMENEALAGTAKTLSETSMEGESALSAALDVTGGGFG